MPDFIGTRYGGNWARLVAVIILVVTSFTYVTAQINATGTIAARALHIPFEVGVWFGLLGILLCSMLGGMRAVTWTQVAQYIVLIIAYLIPVIWMSNKQGFGIIPHFTYGEAVARIGRAGADAGRRRGGAGESARGENPHQPAQRTQRQRALQLAVRNARALHDGRNGVAAAHP